MRKDDLSIFQSPLLPDEELRFVGRADNGDDISDGLLCAGNSVVGYVEDGVPSLTAPHQNSFDSQVDEIRGEDWVGRSWESRKNLPPEAREGPLRLFYHEFPRRLAEVDGLVLEIAAGPGAGLTPGTLLANPDARVLLSDVSIGILQLQREYLTRARIGPNVILAAWDATERVLRPETVAAVSSALGFCSTPDAGLAIRAAFEALVPGGRVFMCETARGTDEIAALPEWIRERYGLDGNWLDDLRGIGFDVESHELYPGEPMTDPDDGGLPKDIIENGLTLHRGRDLIVARKPA
jgi:SAM-dependent methyltransferase